MYGMIHRALRQMVLDEQGADIWSSIEQAAGAEPADFISSATYPDEVTQRLLSVASQRLSRSLDDMLTEFGSYWIRYAEAGAFSSIMDFTGRDIVTFITNLDRMHRTIGDVMPNARMPVFTVLGVEAGKLKVEYRSSRTGLEPFVTGLLRGLLDRFKLAGTVSLVERNSVRSVFLIEYDQGGELAP